MSNIIDLKLFELVEKIKKKEISSTEVTKAFIDRSQKSKKLNSYITENFENALQKAKQFDEKPDFNKKSVIFKKISFGILLFNLFFEPPGTIITNLVFGTLNFDLNNHSVSIFD